MKKIGVMTFSTGTENYGAVLQYFATQEFLKQNDCDAYLLRLKKEKKSFWQRVFNKIIFFIKKIRRNRDLEREKIFIEQHKMDSINEKMHPRKFEEFRQKRFKIIDDYVSNVKKYNIDIFCVGSDQVWTADPYLYFLEFVPDGIKRFSIAPSTGHKPIAKKFVKRVKNALLKFDFITVREKSGLLLCQRAGREDARLVLDPTFLVSSDVYDSLKLFDCRPKKPYIFLYLLGTQIHLDVKTIFDFARDNGYQVKYVASQGRFDDMPKLYPTIEEWLTLISEAEYVITNSFHGTCFSIIYRKKFLTIPVSGLLSSMNERIEVLLDALSLSHRIYDGNLNTIFESVDWSEAEQYIRDNKCWMEKKIQSVL